jgi:hypothetical protein
MFRPPLHVVEAPALVSDHFDPLEIIGYTTTDDGWA